MPDLTITLEYRKNAGGKTPVVKCPKLKRTISSVPYNPRVSLYDKCMSTTDPCKHCGELTFQVLSCAYREGG